MDGQYVVIDQHIRLDHIEDQPRPDGIRTSPHMKFEEVGPFDLYDPGVVLQ